MSYKKIQTEIIIKDKEIHYQNEYTKDKLIKTLERGGNILLEYLHKEIDGETLVLEHVRSEKVSNITFKFTDNYTVLNLWYHYCNKQCVNHDVKNMVYNFHPTGELHISF